MEIFYSNDIEGGMLRLFHLLYIRCTSKKKNPI